jgi:hypothetical protein
MSRRGAFNFRSLTLGSCIATALLWTISYLYPMEIEPPRIPRSAPAGTSAVVQGFVLSRGLIGYESTTWTAGAWEIGISSQHVFAIPLIVVSATSGATAAVLYAVLFVQWDRRRRLRAMRRGKGFCMACGYNLTANTSGVCPECGAPVLKKPEVVA